MHTLRLRTVVALVALAGALLAFGAVTYNAPACCAAVAVLAVTAMLS